MKKVIDYIIVRGDINECVLNADINKVIEKNDSQIKEKNDRKNSVLKEIERYKKSLPLFYKISKLKFDYRTFNENYELFSEVKSLLPYIIHSNQYKLNSSSRPHELSENLKLLEEKVLMKIEESEQKLPNLDTELSVLKINKESFNFNTKYSNPSARTTFELEIKNLISEGYELQGGVSNSSRYITQALIKYEV